MLELSESTQETAPEVDLAADESVSTADAVESDDSAASENAENLEAQSQEAKPDDVEIPISEVDPFAEFENKPLTTMEAVKAAYPRVSDAARERILDYGQKLDAAQTQINEVGETGIQFAKEILPVLNNPNPGKDECETVFQSLSDANPTLVREMGQVLLDRLLNDERSYADTANGLVQAEFGEGVDLETLHKLVGFYKGDLMDMDAFNKAAEAKGIGKATPFEEQMKTQLDKANERIKELEGKTNSTEQAARDESRAKADEWFSNEVMAPIIPLAEKFGWVAKDGQKPEIQEAWKRMGEMVTAYMEREAKASPSYKNYEHLRDHDQALTGGKPSRLAVVNVTPVAASNQARFLETVRILQPLINETQRYKSTPRQAKTTTVSEAATNGNGKTPTAPIARQWVDNDPPPFDPKKVDKIFENYRAARADAGTKVGQRGK